MTVPINLASGTLAGVPVAGLYAGILPILVYALPGSSRQMIVTADAALATLVALSLAPLAGGDPARLVLLASATALLAGGVCLLGHLPRLGFAADLLSKPVMVGFNPGLAVVILLSQLPKLLGLPSPHGGSLEVPMALWQGRGSAPLLDLGVGLGGIALILGFRRFAPRVGALLTLAGVVAYGMIEGIALGVLFSMLNILHSLAFPDDAVLGEHANGDYADLALSPPPRSVAGLLIYRFGAALIFVNSGRFRDRIEQRIEEAPGEVRGVIVDASQMLRIDLAAAKPLVEIGQDLANRGIRFALCCANPQVEAALKKLGLNATRLPLTIHANIAGARVMLLGDRASTN